MRRSAYRTAAVAAAVGIVVSLLLATSILVTGVDRSASIGAARLGADLIVMLPEQVDPVRRYFWFVLVKETLLGEPLPSNYINGSVVPGIAAIAGVAQVSPQLYVGLQSESESSQGPIQLIAFDPATDFTVLPWLASTQPTTIELMDAVAGSATGLVAGSTFTIAGERLRIVGVLDATGTGMDQTVFLPLATAYRLAEEDTGTTFGFQRGQVTAVLVKVQREADPILVATRIRDRFSNLDPIAASDVVRRMGDQISSLAAYLVMISSATWGAALVLIGSVFSMTVHERRRQLGMLRALGAPRSFIFRLVLSEAVIIALMGGLVGLALGFGTAYVVQQQVLETLALPYLSPSPPELLLFVGAFLGTSAGTGAAASALPALRASRLDPYDAIRWGE